MSDQEFFVFQIKQIWFRTQNIWLRLLSRNHTHCILKAFHVTHPKYYLINIKICVLNDETESIEKTILMPFSKKD